MSIIEPGSNLRCEINTIVTMRKKRASAPTVTPYGMILLASVSERRRASERANQASKSTVQVVYEDVPWCTQPHLVLNRHELRVYAENQTCGGEHDNGPDVELEVGPVVFFADEDGGADDGA
jgi:hypothetical protein